MQRSRKKSSDGLLWDFLFIIASVFVAGILLETGTLAHVLTSVRELEGLGTFIVGIFFTSVFTTAPAIVTLGEIAEIQGVLMTAFWGALGAVCGDLIIFRFIRDQVSEHVTQLIGEQGVYRRLKRTLRLKSFRWMAFLIGGLILASPIPDEVGISILGFSRMKMWVFITLSFFANFVGILIIGAIASSIHIAM